MHVTVSGQHLDTGDALKGRVQEVLAGVAAKYFDRAIDANVVFSRDGHGFSCHVNLQAGRGLFMRGEGSAPDAHRAFDLAAEHLGKRLRRYRRRVNEHARGSASEREVVAEGAKHYVLAFEHAEEGDAADEHQAEDTAPPTGMDDSGSGGTIVAEIPDRIDRLTVRDAVMRLDLAHVPALMFRNSGNGELNVIYRRPDGHIGWIDPTAAIGAAGSQAAAAE